MNPKKIIFVAFLLLGTLGLKAQMIETSATMSLSRDSIMIGDTLRLNIDITKDIATEIAIPTFKENRLTEFIEIVGDTKLDTARVDGRKVDFRLQYVITSFDAGGYILDSFPVLVGKAVPFDTLYARGGDLLNVGTYEIDTTQDRPFDIKPLLDAPYSWAEFKADVAANWHWILIFALVIGGTVFGVLWYQRHKKRREEKRKPLPPHIVAISELERIHHEKLWQSGKTKEYFSDITDTLRVYMEGRYNVGAMEMTSAEILRSLKELETEQKLQRTMRNLFELSDLAKFAKATPDAEDCETAYFDAYYFVEQTKIEIVEEEEEGTLTEEDARVGSTPAQSTTNTEVEAEVSPEDKDTPYLPKIAEEKQLDKEE
ncbi:MAG: hypothetical protein R3Y61_00410 [Rikenellaceae bacterium]